MLSLARTVWMRGRCVVFLEVLSGLDCLEVLLGTCCGTAVGAIGTVIVMIVAPELCENCFHGCRQGPVPARSLLIFPTTKQKEKGR